MFQQTMEHQPMALNREDFCIVYEENNLKFDFTSLKSRDEHRYEDWVWNYCQPVKDQFYAYNMANYTIAAIEGSPVYYDYDGGSGGITVEQTGMTNCDSGVEGG